MIGIAAVAICKEHAMNEAGRYYMGQLILRVSAKTLSQAIGKI